MYMYVCMHVSTTLVVKVCVCVYHIYVYAYIHAHMQAYMLAYNICMHACSCLTLKDAYVHKKMRMCIKRCVCA
jgi:hypothetical protein